MILVLLLFTYIIENKLVEVIRYPNVFTNNKKQIFRCVMELKHKP